LLLLTPEMSGRSIARAADGVHSIRSYPHAWTPALICEAVDAKDDGSPDSYYTIGGV
jgi:hypothetical protein